MAYGHGNSIQREKDLFHEFKFKVGVRPETTRRKATPIEIKLTDAENIDRKFRKIFPAGKNII